MSPPRTIRKYPNRRLYDPVQRRYVDHADIQDVVAAGVDLKIIDNRTGEDITCSVLLQVITAREQGRGGVLTGEFLRQMIRTQELGLRSETAQYLEQSLNLLAGSVRSSR